MPELAAIFNGAETSYRDIFQFLAMTGLRVGELLFLTKNDIDPEQGVVYVRKKTIAATGETWHPKHGNERIVPLTPETLAIVERQTLASAGPWLFAASASSPTQSGRMDYQRVRKALRRAKEAAHVELGTVHSFRHAFCSHLATQREVTAFDAMKLMGHSSLDIILTYFHTTRERLVTVMKTVSFAPMLTGVTEGRDGKGVKLAETQQSPQ